MMPALIQHLRLVCWPLSSWLVLPSTLPQTTPRPGEEQMRKLEVWRGLDKEGIIKFKTAPSSLTCILTWSLVALSVAAR